MEVKAKTYYNFKIIKQGDITYLLNEEERTAGVLKYARKGYHEIYIPSSVHHESKQYVIISILEKAFQFTDVKSIQFSNNSKIRTFERGCFFFAPLESLQIPSTVIDLKEGWCDGIREPSNITISPDNPRYKMYENSFIIGKSSMEQDDYDVLVLCVKNETKVKIPSFIKIFSSYSFEGSKNIHELEFSEDSELHTMEENSLPIDIKSLYIPPKLINLKKNWSSGTSYLNKIKVSPNNPKYKVYNDEFLIGKSSLEQENYNVLVLSVRSIQDVKIPNFIEEIGSSAFFLCQQIKNFEFQKDSKLRIIYENGFCRSSIIKMSLPPHLTTICEDAFFECSIEEIEIPKNSELHTVEKEAFADAHIKELFIPSKLIDLKDGWFSGMSEIKKFKVDQNNPRYKLYNENMVIGKSSIEQENYDILICCSSGVKNVKIPSFIEIIGPYAFNELGNLNTVEIPFDSKLRIIEDRSFFSTSINHIDLPSHLIAICESAFKSCSSFDYVDIQSNSELQVIEKDAFSNTSIMSFYIPPLVTMIGENAFKYCADLQIIEFNEKFDLFVLDFLGISHDCKIIMIPVKSNNNLMK